MVAGACSSAERVSNSGTMRSEVAPARCESQVAASTSDGCSVIEITNAGTDCGP
jgi:hypothetical protein